MAPVPAIAAGRPALGDVLFPTKGDGPGASVTRLDADPRSIDESQETTLTTLRLPEVEYFTVPAVRA